MSPFMNSFDNVLRTCGTLSCTHSKVSSSNFKKCISGGANCYSKHQVADEGRAAGIPDASSRASTDLFVAGVVLR